MQIYKRFNETIDEYIKKDDVILDDKYISAYDLYHLMLEQLQPLKDINEKSSFIPKDYKLKIVSDINEEYINLEFVFKKLEKRNRDILVRRISKDIKNNTYSFKNNIDKEFMGEFHNEIIHIFDVKKEYYDKFKIKKTITFFSDNIFDVILSYDEFGEVNINILINERKQLFKLSDKHWILYNFLLKKIKNKKIDILKKIPIEIEKLQDSTKIIVEDYFNNKRQSIIKKKVE